MCATGGREHVPTLMKVVILCGGLGTRLREETERRPKPLVPIGEEPILWHIMKTYAAFGHHDFVLALGYKGEMIKDYFVNYHVLHNDFELELGAQTLSMLTDRPDESNWRISFIGTGVETMTGGRLRRLRHILEGEAEFLLTYGDGVTDLNIAEVIDFHRQSGATVTVTGVRPLARFGELVVEGDRVIRFSEKPLGGEDWINGGYFVMSPSIFEHIADDTTVLERDPLERLAAMGQLAIFRHDGYWQCMDTYRDQQLLNDQWNRGSAPWRRW